MVEEKRSGHGTADGEVAEARADRSADEDGTGSIASAIEGHFDERFYLHLNRDVAEQNFNPVEHYVLYGEREGRWPNRWFDPKRFSRVTGLQHGARANLFEVFLREFGGDYTILGASGSEATVKVLRHGDVAETAKDIGSHFDSVFYLDSNGDVANSGRDPLVHYIMYGEGEGRWPNRRFNPRRFSQITGLKPDDRPNLFQAFLKEFDGDYAMFRAAAASPAHSAFRPVRRPPPTAGTLSRAADIRPHFDAAHYLAQLGGTPIDEDPVLHYLERGEREGLSPCSFFDPKYYLAINEDLAGSGISPFWHYVMHGSREKRSPGPYQIMRAPTPLTVSVIVPNYNHARYLEERLRSIVAQTLAEFELIVLDDRSSDDSVAVIEAFKETSPRPIVTRYNTQNSGNVFAQWQRGLEIATGDLVWICESDDTCEPDFLERIVKHFQDESVMLAFGAIQFCDQQGQPMEGMDGYRESAWAGMWKTPFKRPAAVWFRECLGVKNVISNVGGCVFRRCSFSPEVWEKARSFRIAGDWYLYAEIAAGGAIAYEPSAVAYFRQHGENTSASNFVRDYYYREHEAIGLHLAEMWGLPESTRRRLIDKIRFEYEANGGLKQGFAFEEVFDATKVLAQPRTRRHYQIGSMGFSTGGGEIFPIVVANAMRARGHVVSMACTNMHEIEAPIRSRLDPGIAVYDAAEIVIEGRQNYFRDRGIELVNSHNMQFDGMVFRKGGPLLSAYVPTLHGSHDVVDLTAPSVRRLLNTLVENADGWIYTADKNLAAFAEYGIEADRLFKFDNAMPRDARAFPKTRAELNIAEDATVFVFVARGVERKGWRAAVMAFQKLRARFADRPMHLVLVGTGTKTDEARQLVGPEDPISFLGFVSEINGLYRIADCAVVPTRFPGESNPLCIIQAIQEGVPVIATDIGEIRKMLTGEEGLCGILLEPQRDTQMFAEDLSHKMEKILDLSSRENLRRQSTSLKPKFDLTNMIVRYETIYEFAREQHWCSLGPGAAQI